MMITMRRVGAFVVILAAIAVSWAITRPNAGAAAPAQAAAPPALDKMLGGEHIGAALTRGFGGEFVCGIDLFWDERRVGFHWRHVPDYEFGDDVLETYVTRPTWYWPNLVEWISDTELLVTGIAPRDGATVIEVWEFSSSADTPGVVQHVLPDGSQGWSWNLPKVEEVHQVGEWTDPSRHLVVSAKENKAQPGRVFVLFDSSGDVCDLTLATGSESLVASPDPNSAVYTSELVVATPWLVGFEAIDSPVEGYVYALSTNFVWGAVQGVILVDSDRDGDIDSVYDESEYDRFLESGGAPF